MAWKAAALGLGVLTGIAVLAGVARTSWHQQQEARIVREATLGELAGAEHATAESVRLGAARLSRDQHVTFELCSADRMPPERWAGVITLAVWRPSAQALMTRTALTDAVLANVRRNDARGCLTIGRGVIGEDDVYAVEALFDASPAALADVPLTLTIQARRPLEALDLALVALAWLSALGFALALGGWRDAEDAWDAELPASPALPELRVTAGAVSLAAAFALSSLLPSGAALALGSGVTLALVEASIAFILAPGPGWRRRVRVLALRPPDRAWMWPLALVAGVLLWGVAVAATSLVPSTGVSAVSLFVRWPSGMLSFACLAVVAPLAEEVFFRGFVYGALERRSRTLAFFGAWLLFTLAHAPQTWGEWGSLVAILVTGLILTGLRAVSRSTLVPALAHLVYNGILALNAVA